MPLRPSQHQASYFSRRCTSALIGALFQPSDGQMCTTSISTRKTEQRNMRSVLMNALEAEDLSILLAVERGLSILGDSGKKATLRILATAGLIEEDIPKNYELFVHVLEDIFGAGAPLITAEIEGNLRLIEQLSPRKTSLKDAITELRCRGTWVVQC